jgi:serine/threonine protein kinase
MMSNLDETSRDNPGSEGIDPLGILGWKIGGKYKIRSYIGGGGFGEVYDGFNINLPEQRLVIKFFKRVQSRDKFAKEAKILCLLDHPNILRIVDYLPEEGALIVPFIDGRDGGKILKDNGPLSEKLFLQVARTMTDALAYAHEKKIAHRDLKPGNILIDKNEHIYLIDFGIAKEMGSSATKTAYVALTPLFAAPERQSGDQDYNPFLSDIYELGVTLFNFATNEMPYRNPGNPNVHEWGGEAATRNFSPALRRILKKATHPDPAERYQSARDLAQEFRKLEKAYGGSSGKPKYLTIAAAVIVIAAAAYFGRDYYAGGSSREPVTLTPDNQTTTTVAENKQPATPPQNEKKEEPKPIVTTPVENKNEEKAAPAITQTPPVETKKTEEKPIIKEEKPIAPPEIKLPTLTVNISPITNISFMVDGKNRNAGRAFEIASGNHEIKIIHPDYPVLIDSVEISSDKTLSYNLPVRFSNAGSINFRIGISPSDLPDASLRVSFNGRRYQYKNDELPVLDLKRVRGLWQIKCDIVPSVSGNARVDSIVTFPYGGGPHIRLKGDGGLVDFGGADWRELDNIDLLLFWSGN